MTARRIASLALALVPAFVSAQPLTFTHLAGSLGGAGWYDDVGNSALFRRPVGVASDGAGNVYVADTENHTIRRIGVASGEVTTLAGSAGLSGSADGTGSAARFFYPCRVAADGAGSLFVSGPWSDTIRKIDLATRVVTTLAGSDGAEGSSDGFSSAARFFDPFGIAADGAGNLYVADAGNHTIRKVVVATGEVTTFAGVAGSPGAANGVGNTARFRTPIGLALDSSGSLFVADAGNATIRRIELATRVVTTLAGLAGFPGSADGTGAVARFREPYGVAADSAGNLFVADTGNHILRRIVVDTAVVTTLAGSTPAGYADGLGSQARFFFPYDVTRDGAGDLWVADGYNHAIRRVVVSTAAVSTPAGGGGPGSVDGVGPAARFYYPGGLVAGGAGDLYLVDRFNHTIRSIALATRTVTTLAGSPGMEGMDDGTGAAARFRYPHGVAPDGAGNLYVADSYNHTIRKLVIATGEVTTFAGAAGYSGTNDGIGSAARFYNPHGIAWDGAGNLFVADVSNQTIRAIALATAEVTTLAGAAGSAGSTDGVGGSALFREPWSVAADGAGYVYVADTHNHVIRKIEVVTRAVTTLAGSAGSPGSDDGVGSVARFRYPEGVASGGPGVVYVSDSANHTIRKIDVATGTVTTVAGAAGTAGSEDGTGSDARFSNPQSIAGGDGGVVYVSDLLNHSIRKGVPSLPDLAIVDAPMGLVGAPRQLDTTPQTATAWQWELVGRVTGSTAALSSATLRNPAFTPDLPGHYVFRLTASTSTAARISTVAIDAWTPPAASVSGDQAICAGGSATIRALLTGQSPWNVTWSDAVTQSGLTTNPAVRSVFPAVETVYTVTTLSDANASGTATGSATVTVNPVPATPSITAPASVPATSSGNTASVTASPGSSWAWGITGGAINGGQGTNAITFIAGRGGVLTLSVVEIGSNGCGSAPASVEIPITAPLGSPFFALPPCRLFDTRQFSGPAEASPILAPGETRPLSVTGRCAIPVTARSISANITVTQATSDGHLTIHPSDLASPGNSVINFRLGRTRANNAILELSVDGSGGLTVFNGAAGAVHLVVDVNGYFE